MKYNDRTWQLERDGRTVIVQLQHDVTRDRLDVSVGGSAVPVRRAEQPDGSRLLTFSVAGRTASIVVRPGGEDFTYELVPEASTPEVPPAAPPLTATPSLEPGVARSPVTLAMARPSSASATVWVTVAVIAAVLALVGGSRFAVQRLFRADWRSFHSDPGRFTIDMPGEPKNSTKSVPSAVGSLQVNLYTVDLMTRGFVAGYWDLPGGRTPHDVRRFLEATRDGAAKSTHGTVRNSKEIQLESSPGIEFDADLPEGQTHQRIYLVGTRIYHLIVMGKSSPPEDELERFFASFQPR